ncbi:DMT family transporter [Amorphus sp. 3PC139-8]|uniref:DMT family transporter n=1 Tax=Amorphus sp. 3PC139-8 TaxID=2735676 RepID=UPI00345CD206
MLDRFRKDGPQTKSAAYIFALFPPLFWAGNFLVARMLHEEIPPIQMSFWRWVIAFAILFPFSAGAFWQNRDQIRHELPFLALLGTVGVMIFSSAVYTALQYTTVVNAALINSLMPVATFIFALIFIGDRLRPTQIGGVAVCIVGALFIITRGHLDTLLAIDFNRGDIFVLIGLTFWALYTVLIRWRPTKLPPLAFLSATILFGLVAHLPLLAIEIPVRGTFQVTAPAIIALVYFGLFASLLAYIFWNRAVSALGPGTTGLFMYLMPIFSTFLAVVALGEAFRWYHLVGISCIFVGIATVTRPFAGQPRQQTN